MQIDPVRTLAVIWRASSDPEGAWLTNPDDIQIADLMHVRGLGYVEKRRPKSHQLSFFSTVASEVAHEDQWLTYFVLTDSGKRLWGGVLLLIERAMIAPEDR